MQILKNSVLLPVRSERVELDRSLVEKCLSTISRPTWGEFTSTISPIWAKVLNGPGGAIKHVFEADVQQIKMLYEDFFVNGLSDGAAVGSKMHEVRSYLKIIAREKRRRDILRKIEIKEKKLFDYDLPDFGQAWNLKLNGKYSNFELTDHFYFSDICMKLIKSFNIRNIIFLGDGCGYLAQSILSMDESSQIDSVTMIDLYHFLIRQFLLLDGFKAGVKMSYLNGESHNYKDVSNSIKVLVNQDSLPEIDNKSQAKYFNYMKANNVKLLISYNKVDPSKGHEEFREKADHFFDNKLLCFESAMRPGYWIEVWHD